MTETNIYSDNNVEVIVDTEQLKNSKPKGFWARLVYNIKRIWNKTIFARKIQENAWKRELMEEVKQESKEDIKAIMKEQYLKQQKDKLSGVKKENNFFEKLAKGFTGNGNFNSTDKINQMLGKSNTQQETPSDDKIARMLGKKTGTTPKVMNGYVMGGMSEEDKLKKKRQEEKMKQQKKKEQDEWLKRVL